MGCCIWKKHGNVMDKVISKAFSFGSGYLESSSNRKELLAGLFEFSVIIILIVEITCKSKGFGVKFSFPFPEGHQRELKIDKIQMIGKHPLTSEDTLCVPYLSSQYIVLILYNCCMLST